ncbi:hypothetical protein, partial [Bradyrhizobium liaoningense]|uniref:hypothetical protein n=1 Tax=Bradyrhizobium liaoningense TaxID=43992 RepID=UPI0024E09C8F
CVRRLFFVIFAPDSQQESSPLSGRKSTQATVRICGASSEGREDCLSPDAIGFTKNERGSFALVQACCARVALPIVRPSFCFNGPNRRAPGELGE